MPFISVGEIRFFQSGLLDKKVRHAFFTRQGGVSPEPWNSLNLGSTVGDDLQRVVENRQRALTALGRDPASVYDVWQVHGTTVVIADSPRSPSTPHLQADAVLTNKPGITLMMRFADCVPVMLHDPVNNVIGIVHAGWLGTVLGTVRHAVTAIQDKFGSLPQNIKAVIGPSIGPDHYEVGPDVVSRVRAAFPSAHGDLISNREGRFFFDLWAANRYLLQDSGVHDIDLVGLCTACHTDDWYSHRAERGRTGRFGAIIALV
jgi:polyphenol oxidase